MELELVRTEIACPGCSGALDQAPGVVGLVAGCFTCGGVWIDNVAANEIIRGAPPLLSPFAAALPTPSAPATEGADYRTANRRTCPGCGEALTARTLRRPAIVVDFCEAHGTYFDAHEFAKILTIQSMAALQAEAESVRDAASESNQGGPAARFLGTLVTALLRGSRPAGQPSRGY